MQIRSEKGKILEVCVDSVNSALAAEKAGADRLELCGNLIIGGTTPEPSLFQLVREKSNLPVRVLIRPRFGDFLYSDFEIEQMKRSIDYFYKAGADGFVIGALKPDGSLDEEAIKQMIESSKGVSLTLHRAFDMCREPEKALEQAVSLGFNWILTSGRRAMAKDGIDLLKKIRNQANGRISIMAGGGIDAESVEIIGTKTGIRAFHMSGKVEKDSNMQFRNSMVSMGLPVASEYIKWETSEEKVREVKCRLEGLI